MRLIHFEKSLIGISEPCDLFNASQQVAPVGFFDFFKGLLNQQLPGLQAT